MPRTSGTKGAPAARGAPVSFAAVSLVAVLAALVAVWMLALQPLWATDVGWQLRAGRDLLARGVPGGIPHVDDLSWSAAGRPWIELRWLWLLGLAATERAGGFAAVSHAAAALVLLAFALVAATPWRDAAARPWIAAATLAAALAAQQRFLARPETATFGFVAAFVLVLHRRRALWLLPALQVLWVNTHTLFALGPVLVATFALAGALERRGPLRRDGALLVATLLACLVNPYGAGAFAFAWTVWSELHTPIVRASITELAGPFAIGGDFTALRWFFALLVAAPLAAILALVRARRVDAFLALATALGAALALTSVRNLPLFALPAAPFLAHHLGLAFPLRGRAGRGIGLAVPAAALALAAWTGIDLAAGRFYARQGDPRAFGVGVAPARYPMRAAGMLREVGAADRVFATFHESSWLLADGVRSYCDPRIEVFGPEHLERSLQAQADPAAWTALAREARPNAVVTGLDALGFARVLDAAGWELAWFDETAALWLPTGSAALAPRALVLEDNARGLDPATLPRGARDRVGAFLLARGRPDLARAHLAGAVAAHARLNLAEALAATGDEAGAHEVRGRAFAQAPRDPQVATAWALELLGAGRADEAAAALDPVLRSPQAPARAWALRGEAYGAKGDLAAAERCLARGAAIDPADAQIRRRLEEIRTARQGPSGFPR